MIAKKSFGQHFLQDASVIKKIVAAAEIKPGDVVLEVGPGHGVLTRALVEAGAKVIAVEADRDLIPELQTLFGDRVDLVRSDILKWTPPSNIGPYKLVSNLPYNIASAVMEKFLSQEPRPKRMVLMVQKEVADRMLAKPGEMSVLSVACQIYAELKRVVNVPPGAFRPSPKVDSTVVRLDVRGDVPKEAEEIIGLAKQGFRARRKLLKKNLEGLKWSKEEIIQAMQKADVDELARAQELSVAQWQALWYNLG